jgi:hypothetical protein
MFAVIHQRGQLGSAGATDRRHAARSAVRPRRRFAEMPGGSRRQPWCLALVRVGHGVAHPVHAGDRVAQAIMGVGDRLPGHDPGIDAAQAAVHQALDAARPKWRGLRPAEADDLALPLGINGNGDYRRDRDDAAAVAQLQVGGVEPEVRPLAADRPVEKGIDPLGDIPRRREGRPLHSFATWLHQDLHHSATARRTSEPPLFCSRSTSATLSSVIAPSVVAGGSRNSTGIHLPGDHLSLTRAPGSKFWGILPGARSPSNFHHDRGR